MSIWSSLFSSVAGKEAKTRATHGVRWDPDPHPSSPAAIYQIVYSDATRASRDPGFILMDNSANLRPDWHEYHPIRSFLQDAALDETRFYGFLSPKFAYKTCATAAEVHEFAACNRDADVLLFSPYFDVQALFPNSFAQGEYCHPGLIAVAKAFFGGIGLDIDFNTLVMDSRNSVFCNYFVAKPAFWDAWLDMTESLYHQAEEHSPMQKLLNMPARYHAAQMKVFVLERIADVLMAVQPHWKVASYPRPSMSTLKVFPDDVALVLQCNELKARFRDTGDPALMQSYHALLNERGLPPKWEYLFPDGEAPTI